MLVIVYKMLRTSKSYRELGGDYLEQTNKEHLQASSDGMVSGFSTPSNRIRYASESQARFRKPRRTSIGRLPALLAEIYDRVQFGPEPGETP